MGLVGMAGAERARDQNIPIDVARPRLGERARQREQHGPARQRSPVGAGAQPVTQGVDHERARGEERFDLVEAKQLLVIGMDAPCSGAMERSARLRHLGKQCRDVRALGRLVGAGEGGLRRCCVQRA